MKYILCDMDGTLLNEKKELPVKLFPLLQHLRKQGIIFGAASGRQYYNLYELFQAYAKDMIFIAENGSMMFAGDDCIFTSEIAQDELLMPVQRVRQAKRAWVVLCGVESAYIECDEPEFIENCNMYYRRLHLVDDVLAAAKNDRICKISIYDAIDTEINTFPFMKGYEQGKHMVTSGQHWIDLTNPSVTKGSAVAYLKQVKGISADEIMAFGDYMNDYEMLQECTYSYAMANAHPDIIKIARSQTLSNEEDGIVKAICSFLDLSYDQL